MKHLDPDGNPYKRNDEQNEAAKLDMPASTSPIGRVVKNLRLEKGLTVSELAIRAKLSIGLISDTEHGNRPNPSWSTIKLLAGALGVTPLMLVDLFVSEENTTMREGTQSAVALGNESRFRHLSLSAGRFVDCARHGWSALNTPCPKCQDGDAPRHCAKHGWMHMNQGCPECAAGLQCPANTGC